MELKEVMKQKSFVIVGDTTNEEKFACKIKHAMAEKGYDVQCVGKELDSINDVDGDIDIIDQGAGTAEGESEKLQEHSNTARSIKPRADRSSSAKRHPVHRRLPAGRSGDVHLNVKR